MKAMVLERIGEPLIARSVEVRRVDEKQVLVKVRTCAVCRTDLRLVDGELPNPKLPVIPGHEVAGVVEAIGSEVREVKVGDRVGVPWLGWTCGKCEFCISGRENLCTEACFTGYTLDGGYAEYIVADARYCFQTPNA
jgi:propanol-preferring alcohol dehydrogenase